MINFERNEPIEETIIPLERRDGMLNKLRKVFLKWNTVKYLSC